MHIRGSPDLLLRVVPTPPSSLPLMDPDGDCSPAAAASATGLTLDTLRYYEREGLIGPIARDPGGRRRFSVDDVAWIGIVTCLRDAGLGIDDLRRFTALLKQSADATDRVAFLRERRGELEERQRTLQRALEVLDDKIAYYGDRGGPGEQADRAGRPGPAEPADRAAQADRADGDTGAAEA